MKTTLIGASALLLCAGGAFAAAPQPPVLTVATDALQVTLSWAAVNGADGYRLAYAPYPYSGPESIATLDLGSELSLSTVLPAGSAFYVALTSYNAEGESAYSNIEQFTLADGGTGDASLPAGLVMLPISGGTFIMGNNALMGPQAGLATEHQVTLSDFELSETEVTNAQYVAFLNAALAAGLVEVTVGGPGPDLNKRLVSGTAASDYSGKVLYTLDGTRVMKDHVDDADGNPFTGVIEPENPLNIAYIGYDESRAEPFYVKDPHNASDFDWLALCDYQDYDETTPYALTGPVLNDFANWSGLSGWSAENPAAAVDLPTQAEVTAYPVTFIRWWGATAFASYYGLKLPTEAQWEYAAKGGSDFTYAVFDGVTVSDANWNQAGAHPATHHLRAALSGSPNPFGLYNLGGNAWEWIADNYAAYGAEAVTDPLIEDGSTTRAWRGGSWNYHQATLETTGRYYDDEDRGNDHFGFRVAR